MTSKGAAAAAAACNLDDYPPVTLADLFSILDGEWAWLLLTMAVTLMWAWHLNYMPVAYSAITTACQRKEAMDAPILACIRLQLLVVAHVCSRMLTYAHVCSRMRRISRRWTRPSSTSCACSSL